MEVVLSGVVVQLVELIAERLGRRRDVLEAIKYEVEQLKCFLKDAEACSREGDQEVRFWLAEIEDAVLDVEDLILTSQKRRGKTFMDLVTRIEGFKVQREIEHASKRLAHLRQHFQRYGLRSLTASNDASASTTTVVRPKTEPREAYNRLTGPDVDGFDRDINSLVGLVCEKDSSHHWVIAICGMDGMGKTTLARLVYNHKEVRRCFDCFAWANISPQFGEREVLEVLLSSLTSQREEIKPITVQGMAEEIHSILEQRKWLVILDDVISFEHWDHLKVALGENRAGSKVLLTCTTAFNMDPNYFLYELRCLNDYDSWELLKRKACLGNPSTDKEGILSQNDCDSWELQKKKACPGNPSTEMVNDRMKELAGKMLAHCAGFRLAISVLGGLLSTKEQSIEEWENLYSDVKTYAGKGKVYARDEWAYPGLTWVVGLSYDELPYRLKSCLLYFTLFPRGYEIRAKELCRLWIAEGFIIESSSLATAEDVAYGYLIELVDRYMVQVAEWSSSGRIKTCCLHVIIRELCLSQTKGQNFVQTVGFGNKNVDQSKSYKVRRLAVDHLNGDDADRLLPSLIISAETNHLRSLMCFNSTLTRFDQVLVSCRLLRVLKCETLGRVEFPKKVKKLFCLRFLSFKASYVEKFPSSIDKLESVQTLDIRTESRSKFPDVTWKPELQHLYLPREMFVVGSKKMRLANPSGLKTLVNISISHLDLKDFAKLLNLKKLGLRLCEGDENYVQIFNPEIVKLDSLCSLSVCNKLDSAAEITAIISCCPGIQKLHLQGNIVKLPEHNEFPLSLFKLTLQDIHLGVDPMAGLEKLPNLKILRLESIHFEGNEMVCSQGGYPKLNLLSVKSVKNFKEWRVEKGAFGRLRHLWIEHCTDEEIQIPDGLKFITTLQEMLIKEMSFNFKKRLEEGGEDFYKVQHVPTILFASFTDL